MTAATLFGLCGAALVGLGLYGVLVLAEPLRRILAFNLLGAGVFLIFGVVARRGAAAGLEGDPVPQAIVITGIVVAFAATTLAVALLLLPKVFAVLRARGRPLEAASGGMGRLAAGAMFEFVLSTLIAPVAMLIQSRQIFDILRGRNSGWESQVRKGAMPSWQVVWSRHWVHVFWGVVVLALIWYLSPGQLIWLLPILAGLILSPLVSRLTASSVLGRWARMAGLLVTPEERRTPAVLTASVAHARQLRTPDDPAERLGSDDTLRASHAALLPPPVDAPAATHLPAIAAGAKIAVASTRSEALAFLDPAERLALFSEPELLDRWAALPR